MSETAPASSEDSNSSLSRRTAVMAAGTMLSRLTGFGRIMAIFYALGVSRFTDTYLLANNTPNIIYELVIGGVLSATLVPIFVAQLTEKSEEDAWKALSAIITFTLVMFVGVTLVFLLVAPVLIHLLTAGNEGPTLGEQRATATFLLRLFAPQVFLYGVITVTTALLNARRRFAAPMFAPILNNLVVIGVVIAVGRLSGDLSLEAMRKNTADLTLLGLGTTAGVLAMCLAQLPSLRRAGVRLRWHWEPRHEAVRKLGRLSGWTFGFVAANQVALSIVLYLANKGSGDVAAYSSAYIFFLLPHGVFAVSVMSALQPELAENWAREHIDDFRAQVSLGLRMTAMVLVPAAAGYLILGRPIVETVLNHGATTAESTHVIADVLRLMVIGLPAYSAWLFLMRVFQAMHDARTVFRLYLVENAFNIAAAFVVYPHLGVQGLGLAYGLSYIVGTLVALVVLRRRIGGLDGRRLAVSILKITAATAIMSAVLGLLTFALSGSSLSSPVEALISVVAGIITYFLAARTLRIRELSRLRFTRRR